MTLDDEALSELSECEYMVSLGHSTLYHWVPNPQDSGTKTKCITMPRPGYRVWSLCKTCSLFDSGNMRCLSR